MYSYLLDHELLFNIVIGGLGSLLGALILGIFQLAKKDYSLVIKEKNNTIVAGESTIKRKNKTITNEYHHVIETIEIRNKGKKDIICGENGRVIIEPPNHFVFTRVVYDSFNGLMDIKCVEEADKITISWDILKPGDKIYLSIYSSENEDLQESDSTSWKYFFDHLTVKNFLPNLQVIKKKKSIKRFHNYAILCSLLLFSLHTALTLSPFYYVELQSQVQFRIEKKCLKDSIYASNKNLSYFRMDSIINASLKYDKSEHPRLLITEQIRDGKNVTTKETPMDISTFNNYYDYKIIDFDDPDNIELLKPRLRLYPMYRKLWVGLFLTLLVFIIGSIEYIKRK